MYKRGNVVIKLCTSCNIFLKLQSSVSIIAGISLNRIIIYSQVMLQEYLSCAVCLNTCVCYFSESKETKILQLTLNLICYNYHILLFMHLI
jgi:hypothetical protein